MKGEGELSRFLWQDAAKMGLSSSAPRRLSPLFALLCGVGWAGRAAALSRAACARKKEPAVCQSGIGR